MAMSPAVAGSASTGSPSTSQMQDPMQGAASGDITAFAGQLRQASQLVDQIAQANPDVAPLLQQVKTLFRQALVQKAQTASMQTGSGQALPLAGQ